MMTMANDDLSGASNGLLKNETKEEARYLRAERVIVYF
jgi:hypothetical protein